MQALPWGLSRQQVRDLEPPWVVAAALFCILTPICALRSLRLRFVAATEPLGPPVGAWCPGRRPLRNAQAAGNAPSCLSGLRSGKYGVAAAMRSAAAAAAVTREGALARAEAGVVGAAAAATTMRRRTKS